MSIETLRSRQISLRDRSRGCRNNELSDEPSPVLSRLFS
jgi:hypothetical protein